MTLNKKRIWVFIALVLVLVFSLALVSGCVRGVVAVGWSGGTVDDGHLFVGSSEGRLVTINLDDESMLFAEPLKAKAQTGLFGCSPNLGCGNSNPSVPIYTTPVVSDNVVYIAGYNGRVYAYRSDNLAQLWAYPKSGYLKPFVGGLVIEGNKLFIGCADGNVYALDASTGDSLWEEPFKTGNKIWSTPAIDIENDLVIIGSFDKNIYAINIIDGTEKWKFTTGGSVIATPLVNDGIVYCGSFDRTLYALNTSDGSLIWQFTGEKWFWAKPLILNDILYAGCLDNNVYALNPITGAKIKEYDLQGPLASAPAVIGDLLVYATREGVIWKIDTETRTTKSIKDLEINIDGPLLAYEDIVYIQPGTGTIERINPVTEAELQPFILFSK